MSDKWPTSLTDGANEFTFVKLDPNTVPELKVTTWSNVFGEGGSVSIDASNRGRRISLASINIKRSGSVLRERKHLQDLLDEWNKNAEENWRTFILACREHVANFYRTQAAKYQDKVAQIEKGNWDV
jgi:hypothetical protein